MGAITLQFVGNDSLGSRLIEWYDHGQYSHVDTVLPDGSLLGARDDVIGSIPAGVQIRPAGYVIGDRMKRVTVPCSDAREQNYYDFVEAQIGKPYDEKAIAAFFTGRDWRDESAWFCSELVAAGLEAAAVFFPLSAPCNKIAPDDLLLILSAMVTV
jgi:uncharacterized protein YycO